MKKDLKKIIFIDGNLNTGGAERILCTLVRNVDSTKYEAQVVITGNSSEMLTLLPEGINCQVLNISRSRYAFLALAKIFLKEKPDAIFTVSIQSASASLLAKILIRGQFCLSMRYCLMPKQMLREGFLKAGSLSFKWQKFLLNRLDVVIAEHNYMAEEIKEVLGLKGDNIVSVTNPLDEELMVQSLLAGVDFSFPAEQINIVAAGRLNREKGFDFLISSFVGVVHQNPKFHLYIIGKNIGDNQASLEKIAQEAGITSHVHFEGYQENPFIYFSKADLFVLSSRWEASPNVIFENLYLGTRIVATDCSPILKDIMGSNGCIVPWGDHEKMKNAILDFQSYIPEKKNPPPLDAFYLAISG